MGVIRRIWRIVSDPRRSWRVIADPPASDTAALLRLAVPAWFVAALLGVVPGWPVPLYRLIDVAWLYVVLYVVRQRDEARAEAKTDTSNLNRAVKR